jgi:guanylate kinase
MSDASRDDGLLIVVSGPSAVGKDTILDRLLSHSADIKRPIIRCVTATTRQPRPDETNGIDYHFMTVPQFHEITQQNGFLEYANVHGNWYGTPKAWVSEQRRQGKDVVLKIDVQGALNVKLNAPNALLIFFAPPSIEELERRLRARNTENEDQIALRLLNARKELAEAPHYDYIIINDDLDEALADLQAVLRAEHCRSKPRSTKRR